MALSFPQKSQLNEAILAQLRMRLLDKETSILPPAGKDYVHHDPSDESLFGSIGSYPDEDFEGHQPPNSMGMVLLVSSPGSIEQGPFSIAISGQFDVIHRYIPDLAVMKDNLKLNPGGDPAKSQGVTPSYKRFTVVFDEVIISFDPTKDLNQWRVPQQESGLESALDALTATLLQDPRVYRHCQLNPRGTGPIFNVEWDEGISLQEDLNAAVERDIFEDVTKTLPYDIALRARIRKAPVSLSNISDAYMMEIFLENKVSREDSKYYGLFKPFLLDAKFSTALHGATHHLLPHKLSPEEYRYQPGNGVAGYGITTSVVESSPGVYSTDAMPVSKLERTENPEPKDLKMSQPARFDALSKDPGGVIEELLSAIDRYITKWESRITAEKEAGKAEEARVLEEDLGNFTRERDAMQEGYDLMRANPDLMECFKLMNGITLAAIAMQKKGFEEWRLFQLGFILTQVRAVYERCCPESELTDHIDHAEVLWFATGGGKTEAYLGILIMSMLYERKMGKLYGPTGWMRFPLRMLSVQQFQRLSFMLAGANKVRQEKGYGGHPFTVGYFTGGGTPNRLDDSIYRDEAYFLPTMTDETLDQLKFITQCPYCASQDIKMVKDVETVRVKHVCQNTQCWSNTDCKEGVYGEGIRGEIGIYVSDQEVFRYLPTVMVGTVDRLATIGMNYRYRGFFGQNNIFCPSHGFSRGTSCDHRSFVMDDRGVWITENCKSSVRSRNAPRTVTVEPPPVSGVSFMIQDELHLMSENLGNFDAHYESTLNAIQVELGGRSPKVLSATATIKDFEHHVHHLYQRKARRFPAPGYTLGESFYSKVVTDDDGNPMIRRLFAGIMPLGSGSTATRAAAKISRRYLQLIDDLIEEFVADGAKAAGNLGLEPSLHAEFLEHMRINLTANMIYVNSHAGMSDVTGFLADTTADKAPVYEIQQLSGDSTLEEIQAAINHMEDRAPDDKDRQIVANSVVSHGVDIRRLNMMVIAKWTKSISEYMQVSARVGRIEPGIVISVLDNRMTFESTVFMDFNDYHRFMNKMVESVPINRFSPNLLQRTLPGIVGAWVMSWVTSQSWGVDAAKNAGKLAAALRENNHAGREEVKRLVIETLAPPTNYSLSSFDDHVMEDFRISLERSVNKILDILSNIPPQYADMRLPEALEGVWGNRPMASMRDIEQQVLILPQNDNEVADIIMALGN